MSKRRTQTGLIELAETHNIALAINRMRGNNGSSYDQKWKRALYHALLMTDTSREYCEKIRVALELP
jgi:hypothetical protein